MKLEDFQQSLSTGVPPKELSGHLLALWHDAKGNWESAHSTIQDLDDPDAAWIHAYLHRKEGDIWNADYWYNRASRVRPSISLDSEWMQIAKAILAGSSK